jgi:transposase
LTPRIAIAGAAAYDLRDMAMGKNREEQEQLFATHQDLRASGGHPFYEALNRVLKKHNFDRFVEDLSQPFYAKKIGRPGVAPGVYFRCLLLGYFEGIDSERGIAWRAADSMSLRHFLGLPLGKNPPDHSTLSRTRRLIDIETHKKVFTWILGLLAEAGLLKGKTIGVDGTTLEANAALRSIVRRDDGQGYTDFLTDLAKTSGIETPTRQDLARIDRKRPKKGSNKDWVHPLDPEAEIMKMKDGRTHLAHKQEQAVDMETGAIVAVTLSGGAAHDTKTVEKTIEEADNNLGEVRERADDKTAKRVSDRVQEAVLDKGYHSNAVLLALDESEIRSYVSEPDRGTRRWKDKQAEREVVYANRRRIRGDRGKALLRRRGELLERPFAHALETGGMRRTHLRYHENILKRLVVHVAGVNLSLLMRKLVGVGKPRCLQGRSDLAARLLAALLCLWAALVAHWVRTREVFAGIGSSPRFDRGRLALGTITRAPLVGDAFTTGC